MWQVKNIAIENGRTFIFVITDGSNAIVVDAGDYEAVHNYIKANKLTLQYILITHHHSDHTAGVDKLRREYMCSVVGIAKNRLRLPICDRYVEDGEIFEILGLKIKAILTPGHTTFDTSYYIEEYSYLFTGDCIFTLGCGRLFECSPDVMLSSIEKITKLPNNTMIYGGHDYRSINLRFTATIKLATQKELLAQFNLRGPAYPSLLEKEKKYNPFMNANNISLKQANNMEQSSDLEFFTYLRSMRDNFLV